MKMLQSNVFRHSSEIVLYDAERCQVITCFKSYLLILYFFHLEQGLGVAAFGASGDDNNSQPCQGIWKGRPWLAGNHTDTFTC